MSLSSSKSRGWELPNELLYEVFNHLDKGRPRRFPLWKRKLDTYDTLLRVSRRWQSVVLPFLWRSIAHESTRDYWDHWNMFSSGDDKVDPSDRALYYGDLKTATMVRHLRLGPVSDLLSRDISVGHLKECNLLDAPELFPFPNLLSLENVVCTNTAKFIEVLPVACPRLESLTIAWEFDQEFPLAQMLPNIRTLRVLVGHRFWHGSHPATFSPQTFHNITTLHIRNCVTSDDERDHIQMCCQMSFPKLRVLRLESIGRGTLNIYDFIQRHPTILQVALEFDIAPNFSPRLESLVKLITGTGVWRKPRSPSAILVDQPSYKEFNVHMPVPPNFDMSYGALLRFAYSRLPLLEPVEPHEPRYKCTGLAICFGDELPLPGLGLADYDSRDGIDFVHDIISEGKALACFKDLEELNLSSAHFSGGELGFSETMDLLTRGLSKLKKLRSLRIYFPALAGSSWGSGMLYADRNRGDRHVRAKHKFNIIPFLDEVCPRAFVQESNTRSELKLRPRTLRHMRLTNYRVEQLEAAVREALLLDAEDPLDEDAEDPLDEDAEDPLDEDAEDPLDEDDDGLLLRAWEARNQVKMERIVQGLAKACLALERFEWWALSHKERDGVVHWDWRIDRRSRPSDSKRVSVVEPQRQDPKEVRDEKVNGEESDEDSDLGDEKGKAQDIPDHAVRLNGNLTWTGCLKGTPPEFPVLVGDELEYQYSHAWGRSRPL